MKRPFAIVPYPLSGGFRQALEAEIGAQVEYLDVPTLRRMGTRALVGELRRRKGHPCLLPLEDPAAEALLPMLGLLAAASGASSIEVIGPDFERTPSSRGHAVRAAAGLGFGSLQAATAARRATRELRELANAPRVEARAKEHSALYVNGNLWYGVKAGGSVGHVAGVVNGLLDCGYAVDVAATTIQPLVAAQAQFVQLTSPKRFGLPSELNQYAFSQSTADRLVERLAERPRGLIYQRLSFGTYAGAVISRSRRIPLVLEYNGSEVWVARNWGRPPRNEQLALAAEDASLRHAHLVVTVSRVLGDELLERGVAPERLVVHPNGVDPERFDPAKLTDKRLEVRERLGIPPESIVVAFIGTFGRWHGAEVLAESARRLAETDPGWVEQNRLRFVFVGDGLRMPAVVDSLGDRGLEISSLTGLVPQAEAPAYLAAADILASPHVPNDDGTPFFGSPTKLFEYMVMGKPIVASELDQIGEVLSPGVAADELPGGPPDGRRIAVLTRPGDPSSLERGLRFLVDNPEWRDALGAAARARALESYTWTHHVQAILERLAALDLVEPESTQSR